MYSANDINIEESKRTKAGQTPFFFFASKKRSYLRTNRLKRKNNKNTKDFYERQTSYNLLSLIVLFLFNFSDKCFRHSRTIIKIK